MCSKACWRQAHFWCHFVIMSENFSFELLGSFLGFKSLSAKVFSQIGTILTKKITPLKPNSYLDKSKRDQVVAFCQSALQYELRWSNQKNFITALEKLFKTGGNIMDLSDMVLESRVCCFESLIHGTIKDCLFTKPYFHQKAKKPYEKGFPMNISFTKKTMFWKKVLIDQG